MKIAVISPGCFGDCVNSTLTFAPLKSAYKNSILDVYTSTKYHTAFINNPYIDNLHQTKAEDKNSALNLVHVIKPVGYDIIINSHPLINKMWSSHIHPELGENLILTWVNTLESYKIPYDLPLKTDLVLTDNETNQAKNFIDNVNTGKRFVLLECEGESGQSFWNPGWTKDVVLTMTKLGYIVLINCIQQRELATKLQLETANKAIWVGGASLRVVSGMYDYCDIFISVSSGLSNACNVQQRKPVANWIEVVNSLACSSNVIGSNKKTFWHQNDQNTFCSMLRERFKSVVI